MQIQKIIAIMGIVFLAEGALLADRVRTDYDHRVDFSKYRTFMWIKEAKPDAPFMKDRIMQAVNRQLEARGLKLVEEGADLAVGAHLATDERRTWETYYSGGGWRWGGGGWSRTVERTYDVGTLTVDLFDARSKRILWQGVARRNLSSRPERQTRRFERQIERMFRDFPSTMPRESRAR